MTTAAPSMGQLLALGAPALVVGLVWLWRSRLPLGWTTVVDLLMLFAVSLSMRFVALPLANLLVIRCDR